MIIDESVPPPSHSLPCLSLSIASAVCYTPEFPSTKSSDLANKSYITMIKRYSTSLLGKVENHCISRNLERQAKLGCHLSKRRMQSYMATIRICWEAWNAMRLRTSLGKPWFSVMSCQETHLFHLPEVFRPFCKARYAFYILSLSAIITKIKL